MELTEDQKRRMEENRRRAMALRAAKLGQSSSASALSSCNIVPSAPLVTVSSKTLPARNLVSKPDLSVFAHEPKKNGENAEKNVTSKSFFCRSQQNQLKSFKHPKSNSEPCQSRFNSHSSPPKKYSSSGFSNKALKGSCSLISTDRFIVDVGYHQQLLEIFKTIPSRVYEAQEKKWNFLIADHDKLITAIAPLRPDVLIAPLPRIVLKLFSSPAVAIPAEVDFSRMDPVLTDALMPFQKEGVRFGIQKQGRLLIADDMGLGKTIQAIGIASFYKDVWPLLVVSPSSVRYTWLQSFERWLPSLDPQSIKMVNTGKDELGNHKVYIISYDLLTKLKGELAEKRFCVGILDESHFIKSEKTWRTKAVTSILKSAQHVILLSGTPALSRPIELFPQLNLIAPRVFNSYGEFGRRYCNGQQNKWGWDYSGSSNVKELVILLQETIMIRRMKSDVIQDLPAKQRQLVLLDPAAISTNRKLMRKFEEEMHNKTMTAMETRGTLLSYYHETGFAKLSAICKYVEEMLESGKKFLCFGHHVAVLDGICDVIEKKCWGCYQHTHSHLTHSHLLRALPCPTCTRFGEPLTIKHILVECAAYQAVRTRCGLIPDIAHQLADDPNQHIKYIRIDGTTKSEVRTQLCDKFQQNDDYRIAVLSITAANAGITLTAANLVVFVELFWNPGILTQAEDRVHRIGQEDSVFIQYLVAKKTADDYLWLLIQHKLDVLNEVGLSKDCFSDASTTVQADSSQKKVEDFFQHFKDVPADVWEDPSLLTEGVSWDEPEVKKPKI